MNLLLIDSIDIPFGGAHSVHVSLLVKGLREAGTNTILVIPYGQKKEHLRKSKNKVGHFDGVPFCIVRESLKTNKLLRFYDKSLSVLAISRLILNRRRKRRLDAVLIHETDLLRDLPMILISLLLRVPLYFWYVEKMSSWEDYRGITGYLNRFSQKLSEKVLPSCAAGMIVISTALKNHYKRYISEKRILLSPILVSESSKNVSNDIALRLKREFNCKRLLVYTGSFGEKDGVLNLIDAFSVVLTKHPYCFFVMTGKSHIPGFMQKVEEKINALNLQGRILLAGFVDSNTLYDYTNNADVLFVCRSNSEFANHGFPWKLGEYCMTGKPIVATDVSDISLYFKDNESLFIIKSNRPEFIAEKINYIFNNYQQSLSVANEGRRIALEKFQYTARALELFEFIKLTT